MDTARSPWGVTTGVLVAFAGAGCRGDALARGRLATRPTSTLLLLHLRLSPRWRSRSRPRSWPRSRSRPRSRARPRSLPRSRSRALRSSRSRSRSRSRAPGGLRSGLLPRPMLWRRCSAELLGPRLDIGGAVQISHTPPRRVGPPRRARQAPSERGCGAAGSHWLSAVLCGLARRCNPAEPRPSCCAACTGQLIGLQVQDRSPARHAGHRSKVSVPGECTEGLGSILFDLAKGRARFFFRRKRGELNFFLLGKRG